MRSFAGAAGDCSGAGIDKLSPPSKPALSPRLLHDNAGVREAEREPGPMPIWFAALMASRCQVEINGENHTVRWNCIAGRALYTNQGTAAERIEPLGVQLQGGHTVAVYWRPGATDYTVEIYSQSNYFRA